MLTICWKLETFWTDTSKTARHILTAKSAGMQILPTFVNVYNSFKSKQANKYVEIKRQATSFS